MSFIGTKAKKGTEPVTLHPRIRTLVVNDSPFMLKTLAQILKKTANFDLLGTATKGCQALRQVSALSPDLVLMEVHLSCLNGLQATQHIKHREHPPTVLIISSDSRPVTKAMAEKAGADGFLSKEGDLQGRMISTLEDLFGPNGAIRAAATDTSSRRLSQHDFREAHNASMRSTRAHARTLPAVPRPQRLPPANSQPCASLPI